VSDRPDHANEIRRYLTDPVKLCKALGLSKDARQNADGWIVYCPVHSEKTPSCSVTRGPDGTVRVRCWGCDFAGDAFHLVAAVRGLDCHRDFVEVMAQTAELVGLAAIAEEVRAGKPPAETRSAPEQPPASPEKVYPPELQVLVLWRDAGFVNEDTEASACLVDRMIDPDGVAERDLARVIRIDQVLPAWARYRGNSDESKTWLETGHRMILPAYDASGELRSVRAWRIRRGESPKRLPPSGHRGTGLVVANESAVRMLKGERAPVRLIVAEGEPDYLTDAVRFASDAVIGVFSGSWSKEFAQRIPLGSEVIVRTDLDQAGEKYAREILGSLKGRCALRRLAA
jgi:hypothetical protein